MYPLLGARLNDWQFVATDADATNVDYASANVAQNDLTDKIKGRERLCCMMISASTELCHGAAVDTIDD